MDFLKLLFGWLNSLNFGSSIKEISICYVALASIIPSLNSDRDLNEEDCKKKIAAAVKRLDYLKDEKANEVIDVAKSKFDLKHDEYKSFLKKKKEYPIKRIAFCSLAWIMSSMFNLTETHLIIKSILFFVCAYFVYDMIMIIHKANASFEELEHFYRKTLKETTDQQKVVVRDVVKEISEEM